MCIRDSNIVAKRKELDNKVDFFLSMEDTTTLIVMETGENLAYLEDGIGYYSYYPNIRGGSADSLVVSATNKYSSAGIDQYLVEGGAVAVAAYYIPQKKMNVEEIVMIAITAAATFALLDMYAPSIGSAARQGTGFGIGANMSGFPQM